MFALTIGMMIFVFLGAYPLAGFLADRPWLFLFYWIFCGFLVITTVILALYDLLRVTQEGREDLGRFDSDELRKQVEEIQAKLKASKRDQEKGKKSQK